jgi:O-antigen/teichoic acid export membrane protein
VEEISALPASAGSAECPAPLRESESAPGRSRTALAAFSWITLVARSVITMAAGFVATPYLLRFLGAERLGAFRASQQWTNYLTFLYVGLGPTLVVLLLKPASRGDLAATVGVLKSGMRITMRQTLWVVLPAGIVIAWFMPELVGASASIRSELRWGTILGLVSFLLAPLDVFRAVLACRQLGSLVNLGLSVQSVAISGVAVWLAWLGWGLPGQFVASVIGIAAFSAISAYFAVSHLSGYMNSRRVEVDRTELWNLRWPMFLTGIGGQMNMFTDYIIVSLVADPAAVVTFSITQRLMTVLGGFVSAFSEVSWAGLAELRVAGQSELFERRVLELIRIFLGAGLCLLATLAAFNQHFVRLWVGLPYYGGDALTVLTAVQTAVVAYFMFFGWTIDMAGDTRYRVVVALPGAILNIILSALLGRSLGLYGVTLATVVAYLIGEAWYSPYLFCNRYGVSGRVVVRETIRSIVLAAPWAALVWWTIARSSFVMGWFSFTAAFGAAALVTTAYAWFVVLRTEDRTLWRMRATAILNSRSSRGAIR